MPRTRHRTCAPTTAALAITLVAATAAAQPTTRVNVLPGGVQSNGFNTELAASDDGRHVIFASTANNLVPGGSTGRQVFALDRDPDGNGVFDENNTAFALMSRGTDGLPGNGPQGGFNGQYGVDCSADGRFVLWSSQSTNLVAGDTTGFGTYDVFVRDRDPDGNGVFDEGNGVNERVNEAIAGQPNNPDNGADQMGISGDGRYVVFSSSSWNLFAGDVADHLPNIYIRDRQTGTINKLDSFTATQNTGSRYPQISADGAWVIYAGYGDIFNDPNNHIYAVGPSGTNPINMSVNDLGVSGDGDSGTNPNTRGPRVSADGRYVTFFSIATNLDVTRPADQPNMYKLFVHDRDSDGNGAFDEAGGITTRRIDVGPGGATPDGLFARDPDISGDGATIAFVCNATNLVAGDTTTSTNVSDVYLYEVLTGTLGIASRATDGTQASANSSIPVLTGDGSQILFASTAINIVPMDTNGRADIFARLLATPPCNAADVSAPFGTLDLSDINAFVAAFTGMLPPADLDGNGLYDLGDITTFVNAFTAGCP